MAAPRKYPVELKERATRLALDARSDALSRRGASSRIAEQLDVYPEALRNWVRVAEGKGTGHGRSLYPEPEPVSDRA